jgi:hypothetical protein
MAAAAAMAAAAWADPLWQWQAAAPHMRQRIHMMLSWWELDMQVSRYQTRFERAAGHRAGWRACLWVRNCNCMRALHLEGIGVL